MIGKTISRYRIVEKLGEGGMGTVYRAEDTRLHRTVALKFLSPEASGSREHRARFLKEAEATAALDHPNITTLYDIGDEGSRIFIAMSFIEGTTLAEKVRERPLPLDRALDIGLQIAEALRAAHSKGIVHRDVKAGNVMITPDGQVKVLDFGLAHLAGQTRITKTGSIMGTPAYMSPEQVRGETADHRTDIWSLGVVLYEMLAGHHPFEAENDQGVLYNVVHTEPEPITAQRTRTPPEVETAVSKALAKELDERYAHIEDLIVDLRRLQRRIPDANKTTALNTASRSDPPPKSRKLEAVLAALLLASIAAIAVQWTSRPTPAPERHTRKFSITPTTALLSPKISPDGMHIAYISGEGDGHLWVHDFSAGTPRLIERTSGARGLTWSPDSLFVSFSIEKDLMKVPAAGGLPVRLSGLVNRFSPDKAWSPGGEMIVFRGGDPGHEDGLYAIPSSGGSPELLLQQGRRPVLLSSAEDGRLLLFDSQGQLTLRGIDNGIQVDLIEGRGPVYCSSGHIVYQSSVEGGLWAIPFSVDTMERTGEPFVISETGREVSVSADGTLAYIDGGEEAKWQLVLLDRDGRGTQAVGQQWSNIYYPEFSPDEKSIVMRGLQNDNHDIWILDLARQTRLRVTRHPGLEAMPIWSRADSSIAFMSNRNGNYDLYVTSPHANGQVRELVATAAPEYPSDWSADGRRLLFWRRNSETANDILYIEKSEGSQDYSESALLNSPYNESHGVFSPDGRYVAYSSEETGSQEVWITTFPAGDRKWPVSAGGGSHPVWSTRSGELFYVGEGAIQAVPVTTSPELSIGTPAKLFPLPMLRGFGGYDVTADGQQFVIAERAPGDSPASIRIVQNWYEEFRDRQQ